MYSDGKIHDLEWFNEVYKAETVTQQNYSSEVAEGIYTYIGALQVPANATTIKFEYKDDSGNLIKSDTVPVLYSVRGPQGEQGEQGIQGIQGEQGDKGDTGNTGPQGFSYLGSFSTAPSEPNPHDFYLNTNDGYIYSYEDEEWSKVTSYSDTRYHQAVSDMIAMSNTAGLSSGFLNVINLWVENLTAQTALINQVFAKQITLQTGGSIQSSNYHEDIKHDSYFEYRIVANGQEYIGNNLKELCYEVAEDIGFEIDDDTLFRDLFDLVETIEMNVINQNVEKASFEINRDCSMCWVTLDEYIEGTVYASSYDNKSSYVSTSFYYKKINEIENLTIDTSHPYLYIQRNNPGTQPTTAKSPAYTIEDATGFKFNHDGDIKAVGGTFKNMDINNGNLSFKKKDISSVVEIVAPDTGLLFCERNKADSLLKRITELLGFSNQEGDMYVQDSSGNISTYTEPFQESVPHCCGVVRTNQATLPKVYDLKNYLGANGFIEYNNVKYTKITICDFAYSSRSVAIYKEKFYIKLSNSNSELVLFNADETASDYSTKLNQKFVGTLKFVSDFKNLSVLEITELPTFVPYEKGVVYLDKGYLRVSM